MILIRRIISAKPPLGIVANAKGNVNAIMAFDPATIVPKKNIKANIITGGIGNN